MLYDELRGEDEGFSSVMYEELFNTQFIWAIPIHKSEYLSIINKGIEEFDNCEQTSDISIIDVNRDPFL